MAWIKRNLYFLIGGFVALALMGLAGWYLYSNNEANNQMFDKLNEQYTILKTLNEQNPHPGIPPKSDNITLAKEQQQQLREMIQKTRKFFQRIPAIPDTPKVNSMDFSTALRGTLDRMQHDATTASVSLPKDYNFSFEAEKNRMVFAPGSLEPLSVQLGEVKAICEVLFQAKINSLDNLRRERVSLDDNNGPQSDYLNEKSVTNELAVLTPYELSFRCFTPELASVLAAFSSSSNALLVKTINVDLAPAVEAPAPAPAGPIFTPPTPQVNAPPPSRESADAEFRRRYGIGGPSRPVAPTPPPQPVVMPGAVAPAATSGKGGLPTVLDERQLKITLVLIIVKPLPMPAK
jgi:hypothetical protein